jgi:regulator of RNase E activity RraA
MTNLKVETREKLKTVSTATLATALFKRGLRDQMIQDVRPLNPGDVSMVGEAYTLRYMSAREDLNPISLASISSAVRPKVVAGAGKTGSI